jgi:hypothetical protein
MSNPADAWSVVLIAELVRASEELLLRTLRTLDADARAAMPEDGAWLLSGSDADELQTLLTEHGEIAERLCMLAEQLPDGGVTATYADVRDGAVAALANGLLDPAGAAMTAGALNVRAGWTALANALGSTDVRLAWTELRADELLGAFRRADPRLVDRALKDADVAPEAWWAELTEEATRRLAASLRVYAMKS